MNKLERYLNNLTEEAIKDCLRFILDKDSEEQKIESIRFIEKQIDEMSKMYPEFW